MNQIGAAGAPDRFALARAAGFRVCEPLRVSLPGMTKDGVFAAFQPDAAPCYTPRPSQAKPDPPP